MKVWRAKYRRGFKKKRAILCLGFCPKLTNVKCQTLDHITSSLVLLHRRLFCFPVYGVETETNEHQYGTDPLSSRQRMTKDEHRQQYCKEFTSRCYNRAGQWSKELNRFENKVLKMSTCLVNFRIKERTCPRALAIDSRNRLIRTSGYIWQKPMKANSSPVNRRPANVCCHLFVFLQCLASDKIKRAPYIHVEHNSVRVQLVMCANTVLNSACCAVHSEW